MSGRRHKITLMKIKELHTLTLGGGMKELNGTIRIITFGDVLIIPYMLFIISYYSLN